MQNPENVQIAVDFIRTLASIPVSGERKQAVALVLGSGLGGFTDVLSVDATIAYEEIPGFPRSTVDGHAGQLVLGRVGDLPVWVQQGRFHLYEGYSPSEVCMGVRVLAELGAGTIVLTNAAGALNPRFEAGDLMCISDHINATGHTPLAGPNHEAWGTRFPDMSRVYSKRLCRAAHDRALELGIRLEHGVYVGVHGPQLETPAETRMYRTLGADAVGMSTVLEAMAAHHMGVEVLGISCLTNKNLPDSMAPVTHRQVLDVAARAGARLVRLLTALAPELAVSDPADPDPADPDPAGPERA